MNKEKIKHNCKETIHRLFCNTLQGLRLTPPRTSGEQM